MFKLFPFRKHPPAATSSPAPVKSTQGKASHYPFTEEQIRAKAHQVWKRRIAQGKSGTPEQDWQKAIEELQLSWWDRWWAWTGIPDKKGWDLVQLLTSVSIPVVIFAGGSWFTYWNNQQQQKIAEDRRKQDIQLANDKAKQDTLVKYLDDMSKSIEGGLLNAASRSNPFIVAQSRTVLSLQSLDKKRQQLVIQFLRASGLNWVSDDEDTQKYLKKLNSWNRSQPPKNARLGLLYRAQMEKANLTNSDLSGSVLIEANLRDADLGCNPPDSQEFEHCSDWSVVDLRYANLSIADLSGASLNRANLTRANLWGANLRYAYLKRAILSGVYLERADLSKSILLHTDLADAEGLTQKQLEGDNPPLLCNVRLPKNIKGIGPNRDCDRIPEVLLKRYPKAYPDLQSAQMWVNQERQEKFE